MKKTFLAVLMSVLLTIGAPFPVASQDEPVEYNIAICGGSYFGLHAQLKKDEMLVTEYVDADTTAKTDDHFKIIDRDDKTGAFDVQAKFDTDGHTVTMHFRTRGIKIGGMVDIDDQKGIAGGFGTFGTTDELPNYYGNATEACVALRQAAPDEQKQAIDQWLDKQNNPASRTE